MLPGRASIGPVVSTTVTLNVLLAVLPAASVAEQLTMVVPRGKVLPEAGEQLTATLPLTRPFAVGGV
jgi:hypothetical protein